LADFIKWMKNMKEMIDEWKAVDLLLSLGEIYSDLGPVWIVEEEQIEDGNSLTVRELEFRLRKLIKITPEPFDKKLLQIYHNLRVAYTGYNKNEKLVPRDSETGRAILRIMRILCDYLKNSWRKLHEMEERVLEIFPPAHFDFRPQISNLNREHFHYSILDSLQKAITFFGKKEYSDCIDCCGQASEKLTESLIEFRGLRCEKNWRSNLDMLRKNLRKCEITLIDFHWLICYLLDVVYFMRNPHLTKAIDIPEWMDNYQKHMRRNQPRWARIALICSLEAAEIFQEIIEHS